MLRIRVRGFVVFSAVDNTARNARKNCDRKYPAISAAIPAFIIALQAVARRALRLTRVTGACLGG